MLFHIYFFKPLFNNMRDASTINREVIRKKLLLWKQKEDSNMVIKTQKEMIYIISKKHVS